MTALSYWCDARAPLGFGSALGPGAKQDVVLVSETGSRLLFTAEDPSSMCWEQLPFSGVALATGDLDGDQRDEIAVLDAQGQVSVWTRE